MFGATVVNHWHKFFNGVSVTKKFKVNQSLEMQIEHEKLKLLRMRHFYYLFPIFFCVWSGNQFCMRFCEVENTVLYLHINITP